MKKTIFILLMIFAVTPFCIFSETDTVSFVIAPPPVGYPVFERGSRKFLVSGNALYADYDLDSTSLKIFGPSFFGIYQHCLTDKIAVNGQLGAAILAGSEYSLMIMNIPLSINTAYEAFKNDDFSFYLIAGAGGDIGRSSMKITVPQLVGMTLVEDETTMTNIITTGKITGGMQANIGLGKMIFSPYGLYTYTAGSYTYSQESSMSFDYPSSSGSISGFSTMIFGFDLLYTPNNMSLSSQLQNSDDSTIISLALKWLLQ